jgi:hypothetical protein
VGLLSADQELGGVGVRVQRVGGDDRPGKVQRLRQGLEGGDLAGGAVDLALGQHRAGGVVHTGQQVDLAAGGGHGQDGDQRVVAAAAGGSRVGDAGQVGEQVRSLGLLERVSIAQRVKARRDRG